MFFKNLSQFNYTFKDLGVQSTRAINLFKRARIDLTDKTHRDSFYYYNIQAGDTPEIISQNAYGNPHYFWAILMFNDIVNPFSEMPRSDEVVEKLEEQLSEDTGSFFYEDDSELGLNFYPVYNRARFPRVGDILVKRFEDKNNAFAGFKDSEGNMLSPLSESTHRLFATTKDYDFYNSQLGNEHIKNTLLGEFLGASGGGSVSIAELDGVSSLTSLEIVKQNADSIKRIKIPDANLLQPMLSAMSDALNKSPLSDSVVAKYNSRVK